jgi:hypothetical protein
MRTFNRTLTETTKRQRSLVNECPEREREEAESTG